MSSKVLFGNNLDRLNPDSRNTLTKIARALLAVDIDKVRLEGHTDNYGDEGYNQKLSERAPNRWPRYSAKPACRRPTSRSAALA